VTGAGFDSRRRHHALTVKAAGIERCDIMAERILIDDMTVAQGTVTADSSHSLRLVMRDSGDNFIDLIVGTSDYVEDSAEVIESRTAWIPLDRDDATRLMLALAVVLRDGM
jgi:hypothetical protein